MLLPRVEGRKLLLVPRAIVRRIPTLNVDAFYRDEVLPYLEDLEYSNPSSELVHLLRDGRLRVYRKDLRRKYGDGKLTIVSAGLANPRLLESFKQRVLRHPNAPMSQEDLAEAVGAPQPDWERLLSAMTSVEVGSAGATSYHRAAQDVLTALFTPDLSFPRREAEINQGRKRVDIAFTNTAAEGFFAWLGRNYFAPNLFVECKNYSADPENPELDQLTGRFSLRRGKVGILLCRHFANKPLFLSRCRDAALSDQGYVIALDDQDLIGLVHARAAGDTALTFELLKARFDTLVM